MRHFSQLLIAGLIPVICVLVSCSQTKTAQKEEEKVTLRPDSSFAQPRPAEPPAPPPSTSERTGGGQPSDSPVSDQAAAPSTMLPTGGEVGRLPSEAPIDEPPRLLAPTGSTGRGVLPSEATGSGSDASGAAGRVRSAKLALSSETGLERVVVEETPDGCMKLTGSVRTVEKKEQARALVQGSTGVGCIINLIEVIK